MSERPLSESQGRRALITGANRGIGRAVAERFAAEGMALVVHARTEAKASEAAARCREAGAGRAEPVAGELRDAELGERLAAAAERLGGLDLAFLNAAMLGPMVELEQTSAEAMREVLEVNVVAQHELARALLPTLRASGPGVLLWMSSGLGRIGVPRFGAYAVSKHGVEGLMRIFASEHAPETLITASVEPGMVQTEMLREALYGADVSDYRTPEETAEGFLRLVRGLGPQHHGAQLDVGDWLPR